MLEELRARKLLRKMRGGDSNYGMYSEDIAAAAMLSFASSAAGQREGWKNDDCRARGDYHEDQVEQLVFELSWELEEASLSRSDLVTVNRDKLRTIANRVLARIASPSAPEERRDEVEAPADDAWQRYAADFDGLTDEQIERDKQDTQSSVDEDEAWLEAIASWERAGKPRSTPVSQGGGNG